MNAESIIGAVTSVTKAWARQRRAEERSASAFSRRQYAMARSRRTSLTEAAARVMKAAYLDASTGGTLPATATQVMYAARGSIQQATGETLDRQYFNQTILPNYMIDNPEETADWDVVFDARGHFTEPHTRMIVPLGTLEVRKYLADVANHKVNDLGLELGKDWNGYPTVGPAHRYCAILFIEKEGFMPLFKKVQLAERFDIAIMSTKGMSVTACRKLADRLCFEHGIPLLVLRDFDKAGFSIVGTLQRNTRRYEFENEINAIDLGLRLKDVEEWGLESEDVVYKRSDPRPNLRFNGATEDEIAFLCADGSKWNGGWKGRRVELNAFTSFRLVKWIESKLLALGIKKVIPDEETLAFAYRRALQGHLVKKRIGEIIEKAREDAHGAKMPKSLANQIAKSFTAAPALSWDAVIAQIARETAEQIETRG